jgi:tetratricopeptide (TPR) repeat protein
MLIPALVLLNSLMGLAGLVLFIVVLVKSFKHGGVLKGLLGIITCSLFTLIWGWLKHKELALTKVMAAWSILIVASIILQTYIFTTGAFQILSAMNKLQGDANVTWSKQNSTTKSMKGLLAKKSKQRKAIKKVKTKVNHTAGKNVDWSQKAMALWQNGRYKDPRKAVDYWGRALKKESKSAEAFNNRGLAYYDLKQYQQAINDYSRAIRLDPGYAAAYNNRGNSFYELNDYQKALTDFNQSLQLDPKYSTAHFNRGLVHYQLNHNAQACFDFQKACDLGDCAGIKWAMKNEICNSPKEEKSESL